jgi:hypothetical protein
MTTIEAGSLVIIHCLNPKEKLWGQLERLDQVGVVLRGMDLNSVEDWLRQLRSAEVGYISPSTLFIPMHRVERVYLDENSHSAECFAARYATMTGGDIRTELAASPTQSSPQR